MQFITFLNIQVWVHAHKIVHHSWKGVTKKLRPWENEDIATLATYYEENNLVTNEEKQLDIQQWSFFWQIVLQRKHKKQYIEIS